MYMLARPSTLPKQVFWKCKHDAGIQIQQYALGPLYLLKCNFYLFNK